jgi:feruloyl esterase
LKACDALDGLTDGLISEPMRCRFDPKVTECKASDGANCVTAAQVDAARKVYADVMNPKTGEVLFPGPEPGSEMNWKATSGGPRPLGMSDDLFKYVVFQDPNWDFRTLDVTKHLERVRQADNGVISATSPNLKPFIDRGGKLIMYHGWGDTNVSPQSSVIYHRRLVEALGEHQVDQSVRLYMVPGMGHCGGGEAPNVFDMVKPLEQWREHGKAPADVTASQVDDGHITRTRPLCPYPQVARYKGTGSSDEAENFLCKLP